jgi:glycosyltransferase involved in cell wall biosynthesis
MNDHDEQPLISCLCVTRRRPQHLARAIRCFQSQTYANKELVIVHPDADEPTKDCIAGFRDERIKSHPVDAQGISLGDLRNLSLERASGSLACIWDDDDWYSPERLGKQFAMMRSSNKQAIILARLIIFDSAAGKAYLGTDRLWENSILFDRAAVRSLGIRYPALNRNEDYEFVNLLIRHNLAYPLHDATLYVYNISGINTCDPGHFDIIKRRGTALSDHHSAVISQCFAPDASPLAVHEEMQRGEFTRPLPYVVHRAFRL